MTRSKTIALVPAVLLAAACAGKSTPSSQVDVALKVSAPVAFAADACGNTLSSAKFVLRKVELESEGESTANGDEIEAGPALLDITAADFNGAIQQSIMSASVPNGTYTKAAFNIHKLGSDGDDAAASSLDPALAAMAGYSVRIAGSGSSGAFQFDSSLEATQEQTVNVVVGNTTTGIDGVTLSIDPSGWFKDSTSGACLNPADAANQSAIEENVKASIKVEEDDNHDGVDDSNQTP